MSVKNIYANKKKGIMENKLTSIHEIAMCEYDYNIQGFVRYTSTVTKCDSKAL